MLAKPIITLELHYPIILAFKENKSNIDKFILKNKKPSKAEFTKEQ